MAPWIITLSLVILTGVVAWLPRLEREMTFHPSRNITMEPGQLGLVSEAVDLHASDGVTVTGWLVRAPNRIALGSAPSLELAASLRAAGQQCPGAIVLVGAFTSALDMGRLHFTFLPVRWILREHLDNLDTVRRVDAPLLLIHGERDDIVPVAMGRRLLEASSSPMKVLRIVPMASHATLMTGGRPLFEEIAAFVKRAVLN